MENGIVNIQGRNLWQHAAGDSDHNHVDICLKWGVILNGPGGEGEWNGGTHYGYLGSRKQADLRRFCEEMEIGDIVVLRIGTRDIYGVGIVGEYKWCDEFNDVDGWELGHTRRVCRLWRYDVNGNGSPKCFDTYTMKWGDTTQRLDAPDVISWLESLEIPDDQALHSLPDLPDKSSKVSSDEVAAYLFDRGIASDSIRNLLDQNGEFIRIANWYNSWEWGASPSEHETVSHLVVPLLRILGWTPQRMALEWNWIDIALFSRMPRDPEYLSVVVEAKKVRNACLSWAVSQAQDYALPLPNCRRLIATDGLRYGIFTREDEEFSLYAYLNLTRPRNEYPIYGCKGAKEAILAMPSDWQPDSQ